MSGVVVLMSAVAAGLALAAPARAQTPKKCPGGRVGVACAGDHPAAQDEHV